MVLSTWYLWSSGVALRAIDSRNRQAANMNLNNLNFARFLGDHQVADVMALRELSSSFIRLSLRNNQPVASCITRGSSRFASTDTSTTSATSIEAAIKAAKASLKDASKQASPVNDINDDLGDLESQSSFSAPSEISPNKIKEYDPVKRAEGRKRQLPASRYGPH